MSRSPQIAALAESTIDRSDAPGAQPEEETGHLPGTLGPARAEDPTWCLVIGDTRTDLDDTRAGTAEALLCVADGMIGTRGVLEDQAPGSADVLACGLYQSAPKIGEMLVALPGWCSLALHDRLPAGRRLLDLRDGLLTRTVRTDQARLSSARFACIARPGVAVMAVEVDPGAWLSPSVPTEEARVPTEEDDPLVSTRSPFGGGAVRAVTTSVVVGSTAQVERIAVYATSARRPPRPGMATRRLAESRHIGAASLLAEQRSTWAKRWAEGDVEMKGDPEMTLVARFALFHLRSSARATGEAAVGARGLTGSAYAGHVFWDTDVFVAPVLSAVDPAAARAVLAYRIRRLPAARARAAADGHQGARFPWESAHDGSDVTPANGINEHGEIVPIRTGNLEEHVTADVAWAAWNFACWSGDWAFLHGPGRPLLTDSARYWASRVRLDQAGRAHIDAVIGPDEYHENVNDNAFTNIMARWNLHRAAELVDRAGPGSPEAAEAEHWRDTAESLVDGYNPTSRLYEQFSGYFDLERMLAEDLGTVPVPADLVLGPERLAGSQIIKQADVLMAHHLVPDEVAAGSLEVNLDYYLPRTAHGSSLSPSVHAALLARAGRPNAALAMLRLAAAIDMDDLTETTAGGLHLANLGGIWQAIVFGFAGLRPSDPGHTTLVADPILPDGWDELRLALRWHGRQLRLICRPSALFVGCGRPLQLLVHGTRTRVEPPGRWVG